jgi:hypothetical protein
VGHHVERRDPRFGEDGAVGLVAMSAHRWVGNLGRQTREATVSRAANQP